MSAFNTESNRQRTDDEQPVRLGRAFTFRLRRQPLEIYVEFRGREPRPRTTGRANPRQRLGTLMRQRVQQLLSDVRGRAHQARQRVTAAARQAGTRLRGLGDDARDELTARLNRLRSNVQHWQARIRGRWHSNGNHARAGRKTAPLHAKIMGWWRRGGAHASEPSRARGDSRTRQWLGRQRARAAAGFRKVRTVGKPVGKRVARTVTAPARAWQRWRNKAPLTSEQRGAGMAQRRSDLAEVTRFTGVGWMGLTASILGAAAAGGDATIGFLAAAAAAPIQGLVSAWVNRRFGKEDPAQEERTNEDNAGARGGTPSVRDERTDTDGRTGEQRTAPSSDKETARATSSTPNKATKRTTPSPARGGTERAQTPTPEERKAKKTAAKTKAAKRSATKRTTTTQTRAAKKTAAKTKKTAARTKTTAQPNRAKTNTAKTTAQPNKAKTNTPKKTAAKTNTAKTTAQPNKAKKTAAKTKKTAAKTKKTAAEPTKARSNESRGAESQANGSQTTRTAKARAKATKKTATRAKPEKKTAARTETSKGRATKQTTATQSSAAKKKTTKRTPKPARRTTTSRSSKDTDAKGHRNQRRGTSARVKQPETNRRTGR